MFNSYIEFEELEKNITDDSSIEYKIKKLKNYSKFKEKNTKTLNKKRKKRCEINFDDKKSLEKNENNDKNRLENNYIYVGCEDGNIKTIKLSSESVIKRLLGY